MLKIFYSLEEVKDLVSLLFHYCVFLGYVTKINF